MSGSTTLVPEQEERVQETAVCEILVACSDRNEHLLLALAAQSAGARLQFVTSGADIIVSLARAGRLAELPSLILLDLLDEGTDALETLERLAAHPVYWQIPVVCYTDAAFVRCLGPALQLGVCSFEMRPSDIPELMDFMDRLVQHGAADWRAAYRTQAGASVPEKQMATLRHDMLAEMEDAALYRMRDAVGVPLQTS